MFTRRLAGLITQRALYSTKATSRTIPQPTAEIPDVKTFLSKIGRKCSDHEDKFTEWDELFQSNGKSMKEKGIETTDRRYILNQVEKFRQGEVIKELKSGKKSFYGGERFREERVAKLNAEKRAERYAHEDAAK